MIDFQYLHTGIYGLANAHKAVTMTHRIKTLYGFYTLKRFIEKETQRKKAEDAFLYLMA